jgi:hypothetical protein
MAGRDRSSLQLVLGPFKPVIPQTTPALSHRQQTPPHQVLKRSALGILRNAQRFILSATVWFWPTERGLR